MKHRQFKTECICMVIINGKVITCDNLKDIKRKIYSLGTRNEKYIVNIADKKNGSILDTYLMYYTKEGPIFQKQVYSLWKELKRQAEDKQYNIFLSK